MSTMEMSTLKQQTPSKSTFLTVSDSSDDDPDRSFFPSNSEIDSITVENCCDELPVDVSNSSSKTLLVDRNSNYMESPHCESTDNSPIIEAIPSFNKTSLSAINTSSSSDGSSLGMSSSSDSYLKSDDSSDNQIVPECYDLDREFMSRLQNLDRHHRVNTTVSHQVNGSNNTTSNSMTELLTRYVEGKESSPEKLPVYVNHNLMYPDESLSSLHASTPPTHHSFSLPQDRSHSRYARRSASRPLASSTMIEDNFSSSSSGHASDCCSNNSQTLVAMSRKMSGFESSYGSSRHNQAGGSHLPEACSTMPNDPFMSPGSCNSVSCHRCSSSVPMASSTMIGELPRSCHSSIVSTVPVTQSRRNSLAKIYRYNDNDCESVYTWSIHDDDGGSDHDISLEESYMKKITQSQRRTSCKSVLRPGRHVRYGSDISRDSDSERECQDHHKSNNRLLLSIPSASSISSRRKSPRNCDSNKVCLDHQLHELLGEKCCHDFEASSSDIGNDHCSNIDSSFAERLCPDTTMTDSMAKTGHIPRSSTCIKLQDKANGSFRMNIPDMVLEDSAAGSSVNSAWCVSDSLTSGGSENSLLEQLDCTCKFTSSSNNVCDQICDNKLSLQFSQSSPNMDSIVTDSLKSVCSGVIDACCSVDAKICSNVLKDSSNTGDANLSDSSNRSTGRNCETSSLTDLPKLQNVDVRKFKFPGGSVLRIPKTTLTVRSWFRKRRKSKASDTNAATSNANIEPAASVADAPIRKWQLFSLGGTLNRGQDTKNMDKNTVIKRFKRFSDSFGRKDKRRLNKNEIIANM